MRAAFGDALMELGATNPAVDRFRRRRRPPAPTRHSFREAFPERFIPMRHRRAKHGGHGRRRQHAGTHPLGLHLRRVPGQAGDGPGPRLGGLCPVQRQAQRRLRRHSHGQGRRHAPIGRGHRRDAMHAQHDGHLSRRSVGDATGRPRGDRLSRAGLPANRPLPRAGDL